MRRAIIGLLTALLTGALLAGTTGGSPSSAAGGSGARAPLDYVAMGDSYSAASGVLPPDPSAPVQCLRSTQNYGHVIADRISARLTDVTCGGAQSKHYFEAFYPNVPPQLDALSRRTDLVTMTIGGNDNDVFIGAIAACGAAGLSTLGQGSPCRDQNGDRFVTDIRTKTFPAVLRAFRAVKHRAPNARVAVLGYPWILPRTGGCFPQMPVATGDVPYLRELQTVLNNNVKRAAVRTGFTFVDLSVASEGHDACQSIGVRWVEPVVGTTNPVIVHPNAFGERRMADRAMRVMRLG
jgi:lysophospholipase L1-like esterase